MMEPAVIVMKSAPSMMAGMGGKGFLSPDKDILTEAVRKAVHPQKNLEKKIIYSAERKLIIFYYIYFIKIYLNMRSNII